MPYAPTERNRVGDYLFSAITGATKSIGDAMEKHEEENKQIAAGGKSADYALKALPEDQRTQLLGRFGLTDQSFNNLGAKDKIALFQGVTKSTALQQIISEIGDGMQKRKANTEMPGALAAFADRMSPAGAGPAMPPMAAAGSVARNFPNAAPQLIPHLLTKLLPDADGTRPKSPPKEYNVNGRTGVYSEDTGRYDPDPKAPELSPFQALQAFNKNAERIGQLRANKGLLAKDPSMGNYLNGEAMDAELSQLEEQNAVLGARWKAGTKTSTAPAAAAPATNEVVRVGRDGRKAVFDSATKKFLRYAN
jgi:hypothetical protein